MSRHVVICYRCGRTDPRHLNGGLPHGWATAVIHAGPKRQRVVSVCDRCDLPANTLNRQPETRHA